MAAVSRDICIDDSGAETPEARAAPDEGTLRFPEILIMNAPRTTA
jgi:hypothetical protein